MNKQIRILFIEDNRTKAEDILNYLQLELSLEATLCDSYRSGLKEMMSGNYQLLLLDMTLPVWEKTSVNNTNTLDYEKMGGFLIMKEMKRKNKIMPTILISMFDEFGVGDSFLNLNSLNEICNRTFSEFFQGSVYYSSKETRWKDELKPLIISNL